jgi:hypothetical protein
MKNFRDFQRLVFLQAHDMRKNGLTMSEALKIAWRLYRLKKRVDVTFCFKYKKIDGSLRFARGRFETAIGYNDIKAQHYFDTEKNEYRAFKPALFIGVYDEITA